VPRLRASSDRIVIRILLDVPARPLKDLRRIELEHGYTASRDLRAEAAASTISMTIFTSSRCATLEAVVVRHLLVLRTGQRLARPAQPFPFLARPIMIPSRVKHRRRRGTTIMNGMGRRFAKR
jgi:hypothetical protein